MITIEQIKAARGILDWSWDKLASETGITRNTLISIKDGKTKAAQEQTLIKIKEAFERNGIEFVHRTARMIESKIEIIEGKDCYIKLLDKVSLVLAGREDKELLIMFGSDRISPPEVNNCYRAMRSQGIKMRQLIKEGDFYILGELEEYRTIPEKHFTNVVKLVYGDYVAQVDGEETNITIHHDPKLVQRESGVFEYFWEMGQQPKHSTATERF